MNNVIIIVESKEDPTVNIAKKYGATIFIRKDLNLRRKGYALNEAIEDLISKNIYYDAYFIIDADNVLDNNFIKEMNKSYMNGYDMAIGYRNLKNGNDSVIAACSGLTFTIINSNGNEIKRKQSRNIILTGTGLFINGELIKKWKGFPFHSLTEDYEMSLYSVLNNLTHDYNKEAIFYDEQPIKYKNTINQRIRWIKGYFSTRALYIPKLKKVLKNTSNFGSLITEISGMKPYILMVIGAVLYLINQIINMIVIRDFINPIFYISLIKCLFILLMIYLFLSLMTFYIIHKDKHKINLSKKMQVKTVLFSPLYFVTFAPCLIKALLKKEVTWERVEHTRRWNEKS